jgi:hypothetical protein
VGKSKLTVWRWQERFLAEGLVGLRRDATRPGRKPPLSAATIERGVHKALHEKRVEGTHWSIRKMARATDLSYTSVQRISKAHELKPHLVKTYKLSNDKRSVGYCRPLSRPAGQGWCSRPTKKARSRRWIERSPACRSRCGTMTHDYKRHRTTTLFAALDVASGRVIGQCMQRHRHQQWLRFLRRIEAATPKHLDVHLIADNYATHKHASVRAWLARHKRFQMFHADFGVLAQPGRALFRPDHR